MSKFGFALLIVAAALMFMFAAESPQRALGDGQGTSVACDNATVTSVDPSDNGGTTPFVASYTAPTGNAVTGVCIKSGSNMFGGNQHGPLITTNGTIESGCYTIAGIGTQTVTVTRNNGGSSCQGISHLDINYAPTPGTPNIAIDKQGPATIVQGVAGSYTVIVGNNGTGLTSGLVTMTDALPAGLTNVSASGTGWTCGGPITGPTTAGQTISCTRSDALTNGQNYPNITISFTAPANSCTTLENTASASGGGDTGTDPDATDSQQTTVTGCTAGAPNLALDKQGPSTIVQGTAGSYTVIVGNNGTAPTSGLVTMTDALPAGLTNVSAAGTGWTCGGPIAGPTSAGQTISCTRSDALTNGLNYPDITISFTVPANNCTMLVNTASASGGGDAGTDPDATDTVNTEVTGCTAGTPNIAIDKQGPSTIVQGTAGSYTVIVGNNGTASTSGLVTMTDALPAGLTNVSASGTGWTCGGPITGPTTAGQTISCTRSDALTNSLNYPNITISFTAPANDCTTLVNTASASGGGDTGTDPDATDTVNTEVTGCTVLGSITIIKNVLGGTDAENFCFTSSFADQNAGQPGDFCLDDDGNNGNALSNSIAFTGLVAGDYVVTELEPDDWELDSISCGAATVVTNLGTETVTITLAAGQTVTCVFNNEGDPGEVVDEEPPVVVEVPGPTIIVQVPGPTVVVQAPPIADVAGVTSQAPASPPAPVAEVGGVRQELPTALPRAGSGGYLDIESDSNALIFVGLVLVLFSGLLVGFGRRLIAR